MTALALRLAPMLANTRVLIVVLCALLGVAAFFPPAVLGVFYLLWLRRDEIVGGAAGAFGAANRWYVWVPAGLIVVLTVLKSGTVLPDDANRHLTSYLHGFDYNGFYLYSDARMPHASMWFGFEWLTGHLHQAVGLFWASQILQATAFGWAIALFTTLFLRLLRDHPERTLLTAIGLTVVLYSGLLSRIQAARPEVFLSLLALTALLCDSRGKALLWTVAMLAFQPLYWLAAVYAPAALLLPNRSWRLRIALTALIGAFGVGVWLYYAGAEWYGFFALLRDWLGNRVLKVAENKSIYFMLFIPGALALTVAAALLTDRRDATANLSIFVVIAWFIAPDQIRYSSVVAPLIAVLAARGVNAHPFTLNELQRFFAVVVVCGVIFGRMYEPGYESSPSFKSIKGDEKVLTMFDAATFFLPARYPGLKVAPHMEAGATDRGVQALILSTIRTAKMNCEELAKYPEFTHVVEREIETMVPCLELQEAHRNWRLWRIVK